MLPRSTQVYPPWPILIRAGPFMKGMASLWACNGLPSNIRPTFFTTEFHWPSSFPMPMKDSLKFDTPTAKISGKALLCKFSFTSMHVEGLVGLVGLVGASRG